MFDTQVTIVGNVLTAPQWRRTAQSNTLVANFKVASTARRLDRETGRWVDGNSLRVRVNCWRKLAEGVSSSVMVGDPVVVVGRLYTRDWTDDEGNHRTVYEMEAVAVGHDLSRGRARFMRNRPAGSTSTIEDAEADSRVRGEETVAVTAEQTPGNARRGPYDEEFELLGDRGAGGAGQSGPQPFPDGDDDLGEYPEHDGEPGDDQDDEGLADSEQENPRTGVTGRDDTGGSPAGEDLTSADGSPLGADDAPERAESTATAKAGTRARRARPRRVRAIGRAGRALRSRCLVHLLLLVRR